MSHTESTTSGQVPNQQPADTDGGEDHPDIYLGAIRDADGVRSERPDVVITEVQDASKPTWSRRRAIITGLFVGAFFGSVFFAGYAGTSAWICSARLDCGNWAPIAIVSSIGAFVSMLVGGVGGYLLHKIYSVFKVA